MESLKNKDRQNQNVVDNENKSQINIIVGKRLYK